MCCAATFVCIGSAEAYVLVFQKLCFECDQLETFSDCDLKRQDVLLHARFYSVSLAIVRVLRSNWITFGVLCFCHRFFFVVFLIFHLFVFLLSSKEIYFRFCLFERGKQRIFFKNQLMNQRVERYSVKDVPKRGYEN